jgi:hypothetical protein
MLLNNMSVLISKSDLNRLYSDHTGFVGVNHNKFRDMDIDRLMLQGRPKYVFGFLGKAMLTIGNGGIFKQKMRNINKAIVICQSLHYILMPSEYKDAVGMKVSAHFGVKREVHEVDDVMWKGDERTMAAQDLLDILNELQIPLEAMITFAMKAKVMTIHRQLGLLDLKMFNYMEVDVGFERTPFFPAVLADEPANFAHVCLAKPDPEFQLNFPLMNKPKLWPVLVPWQNNLERDQMFGGYEVRVSAHHESEFCMKKNKGYSKLVHIWKGVTSAHLGDLPKTVVTLQNLLQLCEKITAETKDNFVAACKFFLAKNGWYFSFAS